ncbi:MAG: Peptidase M1, membrane alanine aminopeptidase [uncultured Sphingomonas sp.]|uniref:Aminopeptidase N n=1 Tax=uncultured Sphingomonas sp. TaxID=158754 RepID=A0A6J4SHP4_9SPHN|nr:MAG: Peptidase M1, membrane alanine aminopeptidase [uncultured Sphingomonas sp.]
MTLLRNIALLAALALASCRGGDADGNAAASSQAQSAIAPILTTPDAVDTASFARPLEARVHHVALDLAVDFNAKRVGGTATLDIGRKPGAQQIILDDKGLEIASITDGGGEPLPWKVGAADEKLGAPLAVGLRPDTKRLVIKYKSAPDAGALQWLTPEQTAGKTRPYLFSQGQAIENRSWIPTQDSPGIRQTWEATVRVPAGLTAVMSAPKSREPITQGGESVFSYRMPHSVAPYMIAIAVGDLRFRELGPRTGVWTEPAMLDRAAGELADTEKMMAAAEQLYGPYRWGRYDLLVLPPAFPYGGMENPTLTFLTPTFIAGDKSLVGLVAHELAHSWSGNLVTNATWADSWLNEGFTTYFENRIMEAIYGPRRAAQEAALSFDDMTDALKEDGQGAPITRLNLSKEEAVPDGGATGIIYDKGAAFLRTLERLAGRQRWDAYLRSYFDRHAFQPMTSALFLSDLRNNLVKGDKALESKLQLDRWVYQPGLPSNVARPDPAAFAAIDSAVVAFARGGPVPSAFSRWTTAEKLRFLNSLPRELAAERLNALNGTLRLNEAGNQEVLFAWLSLAVENRYEAAVQPLERFLTAQGRGKFVRPLIQALAKDVQWGRPIASRIYARTRPLYHPLVTRDLDELKLAAPAP